MKASDIVVALGIPLFNSEKECCHATEIQQILSQCHHLINLALVQKVQLVGPHSQVEHVWVLVAGLEDIQLEISGPRQARQQIWMDPVLERTRFYRVSRSLSLLLTTLHTGVREMESVLPQTPVKLSDNKIYRVNNVSNTFIHGNIGRQIALIVLFG